MDTMFTIMTHLLTVTRTLLMVTHTLFTDVMQMTLPISMGRMTPSHILMMLTGLNRPTELPGRLKKPTNDGDITMDTKRFVKLVALGRLFHDGFWRTEKLTKLFAMSNLKVGTRRKGLWLAMNLMVAVINVTRRMKKRMATGHVLVQE